MLLFSGFKKFLGENPGGLFVLAFQGLLLVSVGFLIQGNSSFANTVATFAYFSLVIGVVLQLIYFVKKVKEVK